MALDPNATSTILSGLIAAMVSYIVAKITIKSQDKCKLEDGILQINLLAIEYPYLENNSFTKAYDSTNTDDRTLRYDSYCCIVFNLLESMWCHFKGKENKIENYFGADEMIARHSTWWLSKNNRKDNLNGYVIEFINYVDKHVQEKRGD